MSAPRAQLVELLGGITPDELDVIAYARKIPPPAKTTVLVRVDRVTPAPPPLPQSHRVYVFVLVIIAGTTADVDADDELDDALEDVLHAIDSAPRQQLPQWSTAERAVYDETVPAYEVTLTVTYQKGSSAP